MDGCVEAGDHNCAQEKSEKKKTAKKSHKLKIEGQTSFSVCFWQHKSFKHDIIRVHFPSPLKYFTPPPRGRSWLSCAESSQAHGMTLHSVPILMQYFTVEPSPVTLLLYFYLGRPLHQLCPRKKMYEDHFTQCGI